MGEVSLVASVANSSISKLLMIASRIDQFVSLLLENPAATGLAGDYVKIGKVPRQGRKGGNDHIRDNAFFESRVL